MGFSTLRLNIEMTDTENARTGQEEISTLVIDLPIRAALMGLPDHLRRMRKAAGLTQAQLANRLGVAQSVISYKETGRLRTSTDEAAEWAEACGFRGATVFLSDDVPEELVTLLEGADPEAIRAVMALLRALPSLPVATRRTILAMLDTVQAQALAQP